MSKLKHSSVEAVLAGDKNINCNICSCRPRLVSGWSCPGPGCQGGQGGRGGQLVLVQAAEWQYCADGCMSCYIAATCCYVPSDTSKYTNR